MATIRQHHQGDVPAATPSPSPHHPRPTCLHGNQGVVTMATAPPARGHHQDNVTMATASPWQLPPHDVRLPSQPSGQTYDCQVNPATRLYIYGCQVNPATRCIRLPGQPNRHLCHVNPGNIYGCQVNQVPRSTAARSTTQPDLWLPGQPNTQIYSCQVNPVTRSTATRSTQHLHQAVQCLHCL